MRDAHAGLTRFDEFRKSLGIVPTMLTGRLSSLTEEGLLEKRRYSERPPRDEYVLTEAGRDFLPVLLRSAPGAASIAAAVQSPVSLTLQPERRSIPSQSTARPARRLEPVLFVSPHPNASCPRQMGRHLTTPFESDVSILAITASGNGKGDP